MDLYDRLLASYRPSVQAKKWWWPLFINALNTSIVAAWRLQCHFHPDEKTSHLKFRRTITLCLLKAYKRIQTGGGHIAHLHHTEGV